MAERMKSPAFWRQKRQRKQFEISEAQKILISFFLTQSVQSSRPRMNPSPKPIQGFLSVCSNCGYAGNDHEKCPRCKMAFIYPPRRILLPVNPTVRVAAKDAPSANRNPSDKTNSANKTPNKNGA